VLLAITLPATLGLMMLAEPLLFALFQYEEFTSQDVAMTARSLVAYAAGLVGFVAARLLLAGFAARHDYATPFRLALYAIALNLLLSVLLSNSLLVPSGWRHAGIALATGIAGLVHAGWLVISLLNAGAYRPLPGWGPYVLRVVGGCIALGALLAYGTGDEAVWGERSAFERIGWLGLLIASGIAVYAGALYLFGMRPRHLTLVQYEQRSI
jgi:putative peptidoglycan lipid II flippase